MNELDLVISECPTPPVLNGNYWLYSCGLTIGLAALPVINTLGTNLLREAHRLHHLDHHEPLLPLWTLNMMTRQPLAFCADCLYTKPLLVRPDVSHNMS